MGETESTEVKRLSFVDLQPGGVTSVLNNISNIQIDNPESIISVNLLMAEPKGGEDINSTIGIAVDGFKAKVYGVLKSPEARVFTDDQIGLVESKLRSLGGVETNVSKVANETGRGLALTIKDAKSNTRSYALNFGNEGEYVGGVSMAVGLGGAGEIDYSNPGSDGEVFKAIVDAAPILEVVAGSLEEGVSSGKSGKFDLGNWINLTRDNADGGDTSSLLVGEDGHIFNSSNGVVGRIVKK